jgi:UDP-3-O-[3-hydroxymyristoyl] N-acetylglucosamine deacetylase
MLLPAAPGTGIVFRRRDLSGTPDIPALWSKVVETRLGTVIGEGASRVGVIEHLMAALSGIGIDDCIVAVDGPEPPILDGDALSYLSLVEQAGMREQEQEASALHVLKPVSVERDGASARLLPSEKREFFFEIEFPSRAVGHQTYEFTHSPAGFRAEIAPARTFGFAHEADQLRDAGLARGASLSNTLVIEGDRLANAHLQRFPDEFVRHKILDAVGDLALAGLPLIARYEGRRAGHTLNNALLKALFADPANYRLAAA